MDTRHRTPLISFCTVQLRTLCAAHSLATLCLSTTSGPNPGKLPVFWAPWSSAMPPSLGRGRVNNNNSNSYHLRKSKNGISTECFGTCGLCKVLDISVRRSLCTGAHGINSHRLEESRSHNVIIRKYTCIKLLHVLVLTTKIFATHFQIEKKLI